LKQARYSEGEPQEGTATAIHVVAQQTWLQPFSPVFSPGLSRQAAADRAVLERPQAAGGKTEESDGANTADSADGKDAAAVETDSQLPPVSAPEKTPQTPFASVLSSGGANLAPGRGELSKPAAAAAAASTSDDTQRSLMAAPRRDLEITLAPKELGGLEVRMKSAGDRLELAFVADRGETARLISDKSAALTSQLHDAGIGLGGIDISSAASGPGGSGDAPPAGKPSADSHPAPQRQNSSGRDRQDRENETDDQTGDARPRGERGFYL
jgi:flagellar hook-length control protein FliK